MSSAVDYSHPSSPSACYEAHEAVNAIIDCKCSSMGPLFLLTYLLVFEITDPKEIEGLHRSVNSEEEMVVSTIMGKFFLFLFMFLL